MSIRISEGELSPVLLAVIGIIQMGFRLSSVGFVFYSVIRWLSQYTRIDEPDPTVYFRQFEIFFDTLFAPAGWAAAERIRTPIVKQLSFQITVGLTVILVAFVTYLVTAGIITGATVATHQAFGLVVNPVPLFRQVVAFVVVGGFAVMFHAGERPKQIPVKQ